MKPMTPTPTRRAMVSLALASAAALPGLVAAQAFPSKQAVRLLVPFAPGGTTDLLARVIGPRMATALGQTVIVENKPGAGGALGAAEVAKATPDGYTLLMSSVSTMAANPAINPKTMYDPNTDFVHIINVAATPTVLADPAVRARIESTGGIVVSNSAAEYQKQVSDELELYRRVVREQGLKPD